MRKLLLVFALTIYSYSPFTGSTESFAADTSSPRYYEDHLDALHFIKLQRLITQWASRNYPNLNTIATTFQAELELKFGKAEKRIEALVSSLDDYEKAHFLWASKINEFLDSEMDQSNAIILLAKLETILDGKNIPSPTHEIIQFYQNAKEPEIE